MKRFLSILLAILMLAVMLPVTAMAAQPSVDWTNHDGQNVYWVSGDQSGYTATLKAAITAAYMANDSDITIVCRPDSDVGEMTHGHVADSITIYGNNAYISGGEYDLEVDEYKFSRSTGAQDQNGNYLTKDITITAYDLQNLSVWGTRHTAYTVNIYLDNCDSKAISGKGNVQRIYINGTTGVNNIRVTNCAFLTTNSALYSNANGTVVIENCTFVGSICPVNFNHRADGVQYVTVKNCSFTDCGKVDPTNDYCAPVRFVNSGSGSVNATIENNTFTNTIGTNGDILLGDYRHGNASDNKVTATITPSGATSVKRNEGNPTSIEEKVIAKAHEEELVPAPPADDSTVPGTIVIVPDRTEDTPKTEPEKNPTTGANDFVGAAVAVMVISAVGIAALSRKK